MADKKDKNQKQDKKQDKKPGFGPRIKKYFRDTASEFKKIVWPTGKTVRRNTVVVLTTVAIFAVVVGLMDFLFASGRDGLINWVAKLVSGS